MNNFLGGGLGFSSNAIPPVFPFGAADNGLSVNGINDHIQLGDPIAFPGPADFLDDRIINMHGFTFEQFHENQAGFENWAFIQQDNFMFMQDQVTRQKVIYWTVDFSGNTGQFIGNDRLEPGWVPPFLMLGDTTTGLINRLQLNANDAMEMKSDATSYALAFFSSGNVAAQPAGAVDPGYKFTVNGAGNNKLMQAVESGGQFLNLDAGALLYQFGDIGNVNLGLRMSLNDNTGIADFSNTALNAVFSINGNAGASGTFTTVDLKTVTVTGGLITSIV